MPVPTIEVKGLRELQRAFALAGAAAKKEVRAALAEIGEPIARDAEALAAAKIRRIGKKWPQMRVGVTQTFVYVAPQQRGTLSKRNPTRYSRPNLFDLLMGRAMEPALEQNAPFIEEAFGRALDRVGSIWEHA